MAKISSSFMTGASKAEFNASTWEPTGEEHSLKEIWAVQHPGMYRKIKGDKAEVTATAFEDGNYGLRISIPVEGQNKPMELKLSGKSELEEGDFVAIDTIKGVALKKGEATIVRFDGERVED